MFLGGSIRIRVLKNFALPDQADVIRVFDGDNSNLIDSRNSLILSLRAFAKLTGPETPISQSSAYRTYSKSMYLGLGEVLASRSLFLSRLFRDLDSSGR